MAEVKYKLLKDYVPPIYRQQSVSLEFFLDPKKTVLKSKIHFSHNDDKPTDLILQGENIQLSYLKIDGKQIGLDHLTFMNQAVWYYTLKKISRVLTTTIYLNFIIMLMIN